MKIAIATDHNGVEEKKVIIESLKNRGIEIIDCSINNNPIDDYPDFAISLCRKIVNKSADLGILMCGTGIGMSIAANKVKGIRCAKVSNLDEARLAKEHNNANVIALSYKEDINNLIEWINTFIDTPFGESERHIRRINKITSYEDGTYED